MSKWTYKFFEVLKKLHFLEKSRYAEPKYVEALKPLAKFLHKRERERHKSFKAADGSKNGYYSQDNASRSPNGSRGGISFLDIKS